MASDTLTIKTPLIFRPLTRPARYKGAHGGRGSGKSHFFAGQGIKKCLVRPGLRWVCIREVQKTLKDSAKRLIEDKIKAFGQERAFNILHDQIKTPGGGVILFQGMQDHNAESIKSLEGFDLAWAEEAQTLSQRSLELLRPTIRKDESELWFSWNRRHASDPVDQLLTGLTPPPDAVVVKALYKDNPFFPSVLEHERAYDEAHNRDRYGHIWLGDYEPVIVGAIWDRATIHACRRDNPPALTRIAVAVDPAMSSEPGSDKTGIVVCALGEDEHGYVLEDASFHGTPKQWGDRAVAMHDKWEADCIVGEVNNGGEMVEHTIRTVRPSIRFKAVRATRGKHVRAEPISALYQTGKIHHVGVFPQLEDQMCATTASGYEGEGSPDAMDGMVWGMTELFPGLVVKRTGDMRPPKPKALQGGWMAA